MIITLLVIMSSSTQPDINDVSSMVLIDHVSFVGNRRTDQHTLQKLISVKKGSIRREETEDWFKSNNRTLLAGWINIC